MTTLYIDPNLIFAENAPVQDKPAAFSNYDKGWDESRKNDGRPLIPQMNYLTQQADLKNLYIHENGAALPYKDGITYEENAVVVKDGLIQQKSGASWLIPFMHGSQNLAELTNVAQARTKLDVYSKTETDAIAETLNATEIVAGKAKIATTAIAQAGVNDTDIITPLKLKNSVFGLGQTYQDVTKSRIKNTTYTNSTGKLIGMLMTASTGGSQIIGIKVDGEFVSTTSMNAGSSTIFALIPPGADYSISDYTGTLSVIAKVMEFR